MDMALHATRQHNLRGNTTLAKGLGWFSIGLGLTEFAAPAVVAKLVGVKNNSRSRTLLRAFGLREIANGVGVLAQPEKPQWLWGRVAGDALDIAVLGTALTGNKTRKSYTTAATAAVLGVTALDVLCGVRLSKRAD